MLERILGKKEIQEVHRTKMERDAKGILKIAETAVAEIFAAKPFELKYFPVRLSFVAPFEEWDMNNKGIYFPAKGEIKIHIEEIWRSINELYKNGSKEELEIISGLVIHELMHHLQIQLIFKKVSGKINLDPAKRIMEDSAEYLSGWLMKKLNIPIDSYLRFTIRFGSVSQNEDLWEGKYLRHRSIKSLKNDYPTGWERARLIREGYKDGNILKGVNMVMSELGKIY